MKKLEISQMENLQGEGEGKSWLDGALCAGAIFAGAAALYGTGGLGAAITCNILAAGCGALM
ncbi:MAG: hypothetical protein QMB79_09470 [Cloacibacterium sp.]